MTRPDDASSARTTLDATELERQLRAALTARAARLGIDPASLTSPSPGALTARAADGTLLRLDYRAYAPGELER